MTDRTTGFLHPLEAASADELREHHGEVLRETVRIAYEGLPYYREKLDGAGVSPENVGGVDDLSRIPITSKKDDAPRADLPRDGVP